jgi:hypothetical protein
MVYVYLASAPEDLGFVERLSADLAAHAIQHWYDDGQVDEGLVYLELQKATHVVVILSPHMLLNERVLAALEHARQEKLERIAVRISAMETLPPQIQGVLPLNFSEDGLYQESLETLLEDLRGVTSEPVPELPHELLTALESEQPQIRRNAIESLKQYRTAEEPLRVLAQRELNALVFRERDPGLKSLIQLTLQSFARDEREPEPEIVIPTKEELVEQAKGHVLILESYPQYLWQSRRWNVVLGGLAVLIGIIGYLLGEHWGYLLPVLLVGLILPQLNITIRQGGKFDWQMPGPLIGNTLLGFLTAGICAGVLAALNVGLTGNFILVNLILGGVLGLFIGWLSSLQFE